METGSLGMIETWGITPAIEAADAGSKAANVTCIGCQTVRAGLITVMFLGDVAAVRVAVDAGAAAAARVGKVVSKHVIPRPDRQVRKAVQTSTSFSTARAEKDPPCRAPSPEVKPLPVISGRGKRPRRRYKRKQRKSGRWWQQCQRTSARRISNSHLRWKQGLGTAASSAIPSEEPGKKASKKKSKRKAQLTRAGKLDLRPGPLLNCGTEVSRNAFYFMPNKG